MKRNLLALFLVLVMLFTLVACGKDDVNETTAFALIDAATKKTQALDSAEMDMTMNMSMDMMGVSMDIPITYNIKGVGLQSSSPNLEMVMSMTMFGMAVEMDIYVENGYYYMSYMGETMKYKAEDAADYDAMAQVNAMYGDLTADLLKDTAITKNADGSKTVKLTLDSETFKKVFKDLVDRTGNSAAEGATIKSITISNANVEITVNKDGYIDTYKVDFDMSMTMDVLGESYSTSVGVDATVQYKNPGTNVTVTPPDGYQNYPEVDLDSIG